MSLPRAPRTWHTRSVRRAMLLLCAVALAGCKTVRVYPLAGPSADPTALFEPIAACAVEKQLAHQRHLDALQVEVKPQTWAQFTPSGDTLTLVIIVDDGSMGGDREGRAEYAKRTAEALYACAIKPPPPATPAPVAEPAASPEAPVAPI